MRTTLLNAAAAGLLLWCAAPIAAVTVTDGTDQGQACFVITTQNATFYLQKQAGGFSSIVDKTGRDWVSFSTAAGSAGMYRGVPNLIYPGDIYHPGYTWVTSSLVSQAADKVVINCQSSQSGSSSLTYEFYEARCLLRVNSSTHNSDQYWFLYEGTPGGSFEPSSDYYMAAGNATKIACSTDKEGDLSETKAGTGEWICFGDPAYQRVLFLVHHENDAQIDRFYQMENNMTVFGFGRSGISKYLSGVNTFSFGIYESADYAAIRQFIEDGFAVTPGAVSRTAAEQDIKAHKAGSKAENVVQATIDKYVQEKP